MPVYSSNCSPTLSLYKSGARSIWMGLAVWLNLMLLLSSCAEISTSGARADSLPPPYLARLALKRGPAPPIQPWNEPLSRRGNAGSYVVNGQRYQVMSAADGYRKTGIASWYGWKFHGRTTANGEIYDMFKISAAHKTLPLPSYVEVKNLDNGRSMVVRVNDRGPFVEGRIIDLSYAAARALGVVSKGTARVQLTALPLKTTPGYYVQLGIFGKQGNARQLAAKILGKTNKPIKVKLLRRNGKTVYQVIIGPFKQRNLAQLFSQKLDLPEIGTPILVRE